MILRWGELQCQDHDGVAGEQGGGDVGNKGQGPEARAPGPQRTVGPTLRKLGESRQHRHNTLTPPWVNLKNISARSLTQKSSCPIHIEL